jgi:glycosyltransferase involved in cell wall biosynthesis
VRLLFAGSVERAKGVEDFVEGASLYRAAGRGVEATVCGDGPLRTKLQAHQGVTEGWLQVLGRVSQHEVVRRMAASDFLVVPSRKDFAEGLPFVIQEGLAVRTPLLLSDHPVFVKYFHDGEGVRFFPERNSRALADLILQLSDDTAEYARLSEQTAAAWQSLHCPTKYHDLLEKLTGVWGRAIPSARNASRLLSLAKS